MIYLVIMLIVAFAAIIVAIQNPIQIAVTLLFWKSVSTLATVILIAFGVGLFLGICIMIPFLFRKKRKAPEAPKEVEAASAEKKQEESDPQA